MQTNKQNMKPNPLRNLSPIRPTDTLEPTLKRQAGEITILLDETFKLHENLMLKS